MVGCHNTFYDLVEFGNVLGQTKTGKGNLVKTYSGTMIGHKLEVVASWNDGRIATYSGIISDNKAVIDFVIQSVGKQGGQVGDCGSNTGTLSEIDSLPVPDERTFQIKHGKTVWRRLFGESVSFLSILYERSNFIRP